MAMASTPTPNPNPTPPQQQPQLLPIKVAARKLPVKRKTPEIPSNPSPISVRFPPSANQIPKIEATCEENHNIIIDGDEHDDLKPPPFKFHRIWPESDEIRFLQGLLECSTDGFVFPRDLPLFYDRFSQSMPQPYTKSQLSEKLRRLRKKFRVISTRISRGLDPSLLAPHDRALFDLSNQLWHPSYASTSPFQSNKRKSSTSRVSVLVNSSPPPPLVQATNNEADIIEEDTKLNLENDLGREHEEEQYLPIGEDGGGFAAAGGAGLARLAANTILDVFDRSLKEVRMTFSTPAESSEMELEKRWREQRAAELDVIARRLRLVLEKSINER